MLRRCSSCAIHSISYCWDLPEDVKVEILSRLSESDLITSKLVCKEWNFMISSICLPRLSPPNPATPLWGFLCFEDPAPPLKPGEQKNRPEPYPNSHKYLRLVFLSNHYRPYWNELKGGYNIMSLLPTMEPDPSHIIDCCNGLLLLAADSQSYFVGNPATRQRIAIPVCSEPCHSESIHSSLVFDPSKSLHFKVYRCSPSNPLALDIFSSDTRVWSSHVLPLEPHNLFGFVCINKSVYFNGALYYMSIAMYLVCIDNVLDGGQCLKAWAVELPDRNEITIEQGKKGIHGCIGYSSGCFYYSNRDTEGAIFVWMLVGKGTNSGWVLKQCIRVDRDVVTDKFYKRVNRCKILDAFRPRAFHPNDDVMILASPRLLIMYHLKTKYVELGHFAFRYGRKTIMVDQNWIFPYARSLVSLNTITSAVEQAN